MNEPLDSKHSLTLIGLVVYAGLILISLVAIRWWEIPAWRSAEGWSHAVAIGAGIVAVLPLVVLLVAIDRYPPRWLAPLSEVVESYIVPLLARLSLIEFLLLSLAAGIGEELFFRGFVQTGLQVLGERWQFPQPILCSLLIASVLFGVCHWFNREYAIVATIIGVYLGLLWIITGNLLAPIVTHALYDFIAMIYLVRGKSKLTPSE